MMKDLLKLYRRLKNYKYRWFGIQLTLDEVEMVMGVLEKQIPKKPIKIDREHLITDNCRVCERAVVVGNLYCPYCGQGIDWGD